MCAIGSNKRQQENKQEGQLKARNSSQSTAALFLYHHTANSIVSLIQ